MSRTLPDENTKQFLQRKQTSRASRREKKLQATKRQALEAELDPIQKEKTILKKRQQNLKKLETWKAQEEVRELEEEILEQKQVRQSMKRARSGVKSSTSMSGDDVYRSKDRNYPGLTRGLAPVGLEDEDSDF